MTSWLRALPAFVCLACSTDPTVIARRELRVDEDAEIPEGDLDAAPAPQDDAGVEEAGEPDTAPPREPCTTSAECGDGRFCSKRRCDAAQGECAGRDTVCPVAPSPVCGCDGISYFNDCVRRQSGVSAAAPGECMENARTCGLLEFTPECPKPAVCARLRPEPDPTQLWCEIDLVFPGKCWITPECDPEARGGELYIQCVTPGSFAGGTPGGGGPGGTPGGNFGGTGGGGGPPPCVSACTAIRSQVLHIRADACVR